MGLGNARVTDDCCADQTLVANARFDWRSAKAVQTQKKTPRSGECSYPLSQRSEVRVLLGPPRSLQAQRFSSVVQKRRRLARIQRPTLVSARAANLRLAVYSRSVSDHRKSFPHSRAGQMGDAFALTGRLVVAVLGTKRHGKDAASPTCTAISQAGRSAHASAPLCRTA